MKKTTFLLYLSALLTVNFSIAQSTAIYDVVFESVWESVENNPEQGISIIDLPSNAHWSPLVLVTHKTVNSFWMLGVQASAGMELIAEEGDTSIFENEVNANADANQVIVGSGLNSGKGTIAINNIEVSEDFPLMTLASMIAPTPDWFIGVNGENLRSGNPNVNDGWKGTYSLDLYPYDAGTENGDMYSVSNTETNPIGVISSLSNISPFNEKKIGTVTFIYNSSTLGIDTDTVQKKPKIYPNPSQGHVAIANVKLYSVEVYSVTGKLVDYLKTNSSNSPINLNLSHLKRGVYFLNLNELNGENHTHKLIID
ncbi:spondin domain-containing protein [Tamlana crocina]